MAEAEEGLASRISAVPQPIEAAEKVDVVQVDGLVLMKIIKHCKEGLPELVTGQLLGLDVKNSLEVTNCFPFPTRAADEIEEVAEDEGELYQVKSLACMREVNVDCNTVGWYCSTYLGSFIEEHTVATQFNYQDNLRTAVCLVYDPMRTTHGNLFLKAYRLTTAFMDLYRKNRFTQEELIRTQFTDRDIFEEIPIKIHNPAIINAMLMQWDQESLTCDFDRLDLSTNPFLEKNLECLIDCVDDLVTEQSKYEYFKRRRQQQRLMQGRRGRDEQEDDRMQPEPSRLETLLISHQVNDYCEQINKFAGQSFAKLYLMDGLHAKRTVE